MNLLIARFKQASLPAFFGILLFFSLSAQAGEGHKMQEIDTCYHWLEEGQLDVKLQYAEANKGEFFYYDAAPMYCWRSPLGAYSSFEDHGNRLIRIKFKPGTTVVHRPRIGSHRAMTAYGTVIYSNDNAWQEYTVAPAAIESWSVFHPTMIAEMSAEMNYYSAGLATANDVFYPFRRFDLSYLIQVIPPIIDEHVQLMKAGKTKIYGSNPARHFVTSYVLPWQRFLKPGTNKVVPLPSIKVRRASYGLNLSAEHLGNSTKQAGAFCDGKMKCTYKVSSRFLKLNFASEDDKSFDIEWTCGSDPKKYSHREDAPAEGKVFELECPLPE